MKKSVVFLIHFVIWILIYWAVLSITSQFHRLMFILLNVYIHALLLTFGFVFPVYLGYIIYPLLFIKKTNILWIVFGTVSLLIYSTTLIIWDDGYAGLDFKNVSSALTYSVFAAFIGGGLKSLLQYAEQKKRQEQLEQQNLKSEIALLRIQLNPHFLFNTLHNIDTLIFDNQDKASQSLIKLADIMRYMLTDAKSEMVDLQKEIENLENYMALERLRLKNERFLNFNVSGNLIGKNIAPMILIPFVENAFKHSIDSDAENGIIIDFKIDNNLIKFKCENRFEKSGTEKDKVHGIGLETVKKRLGLIYPDKHKLTIDMVDSNFKVNLEIQLNEN